MVLYYPMSDTSHYSARLKVYTPWVDIGWFAITLDFSFPWIMNPPSTILGKNVLKSQF